MDQVNVKAINALISTFAKENNLPKAVVQKLAKQIEWASSEGIEGQPDNVVDAQKKEPVRQSTTRATSTRRRKASMRMGRQASEESLKLRKEICKFAKKHKGYSVVATDLAQNLNVAPSTLNNNLRYLEKQGIVKPVKNLIISAGRGRNPTVWKFL